MRSPPLRRLLTSLVAGLLMATIPAVASAHVHLVSTSPEAGANLEDAPHEVTLTFDGELDPAGSSFTVSDQHGEEVGSGEVDLAVADRNVLRGVVSITEPGVYTVDWTVLGIDGHEITGAFSFGYASHAEIPDGEGDDDGHETPDTATKTNRGTTPITVTGVLLLMLAAVASLRRAVVR
ncbi:MAG TPA: copper resistance CopC family protein [Candidatus Limnocylindria bacterium]